MADAILEYCGVQGNAYVDWEITPALTYGLFECRGPGCAVRDAGERSYYFVVDAWGKTPRVFLMERGIRFARRLAEVSASEDLLAESIAVQGASCKDKNYAATGRLQQWLRDRVVPLQDLSCVTRITKGFGHDRESLPAVALPPASGPAPAVVRLRSAGAVLTENEVDALVTRLDVYESARNHGGRFRGDLVATPWAELTQDRCTGLVWQRGGSAWGFYRRVLRWVRETNRTGFCGFSDWRLPTLEEAVSLLVPEKTDRGLYTHPCFSGEQGFLYTSDRRLPGGYWFVDLRQARVFWAGGTFSGGYGRLCRTVSDAGMTSL